MQGRNHRPGSYINNCAGNLPILLCRVSLSLSLSFFMVNKDFQTQKILKVPLYMHASNLTLNHIGVVH